MKHLKGDHDEHVQTWDEQKWKDWPPSEPAPAEAKIALNSALEAGEITFEVTPDLYVISKSDSIEHLYWGFRGIGPDLQDQYSWGPLEGAFLYTPDERAKHLTDTFDGFWMTLDRAMELEK
jgi:hypothetical protein